MLKGDESYKNLVVLFGPQELCSQLLARFNTNNAIWTIKNKYYKADISVQIYNESMALDNVEAVVYLFNVSLRNSGFLRR
jgi:hypothetical protein